MDQRGERVRLLTSAATGSGCFMRVMLSPDQPLSVKRVHEWREYRATREDDNRHKNQQQHDERHQPPLFLLPKELEELFDQRPHGLEGFFSRVGTSLQGRAIRDA